MPKTIDDIIPPSRRRAMNAENERNSYTQPSENTTPQYSYNPPPSNTTPLQPLTPMSPTPPPRVRIKVGRSFPYGTALIVLVIVAVCAGALYAFAGAQVKITPTSQTGPVSGDFTATNGSGDLPYTVVTLNQTSSVLVPSETTEMATSSAQGTIVISNAQSTAQHLITNTRFETPAGLIFRIHAPIVIPAESASGPGTLSVTVYSDQPGAAYNIGPSTFTVPGLKGDSSYALVTAMSSSSMVGGFSGTRPAVSATTDASHQAALQSQLAGELQSDLLSKIPAGYVVVPGATMTTYQSLPDSASSTNSVAITEQGTISAVAFPSASLAQAIAYKISGTYSGEPVDLFTVNTLSLTPDATSTDFSDVSNASSFSFTLSGSADIVWKVDASKIASAVAGKTRDSAQSILSSFPEVASATLILRPFWSSTFPQDPSHIHVIITPPAQATQ